MKAKIDLQDPLFIAAASAGLAIFLILLSSGFSSQFGSESSETIPWVAGSSTILLYTLFNTVGMILSKKPKWFWKRSVYGFIGLFAIIYLVARLASGVDYKQIGDFKSVLLVLFIAYVVLMAIGNLVRALVAYSREKDAQKLNSEKNG